MILLLIPDIGGLEKSKSESKAKAKAK